MNDTKRITIGRKRWILRYVPLRRHWGQCDDPNTPRKEIRISRALRKNRQKWAETLIHEVLHAEDWHRDEESVEQIAGDLARILAQEGLLDG